MKKSMIYMTIILLAIGIILVSYSYEIKVTDPWVEYAPYTGGIFHEATYVTIFPFWQLGAAIMVIAAVAGIVGMEMRE